MCNNRMLPLSSREPQQPYIDPTGYTLWVMQAAELAFSGGSQSMLADSICDEYNLCTALPNQI